MPSRAFCQAFRRCFHGESFWMVEYPVRGTCCWNHRDRFNIPGKLSEIAVTHGEYYAHRIEKLIVNSSGVCCQSFPLHPQSSSISSPKLVGYYPVFILGRVLSHRLSFAGYGRPLVYCLFLQKYHYSQNGIDDVTSGEKFSWNIFDKKLFSLKKQWI